MFSWVSGCALLSFCCYSLATISASTAATSPCDQISKVNSFIATGGLAYGYGGINPGSCYPYGPMRLGPDTTTSVVDLSYRHFSGYNYADDTIRAFSHTHLVGAGINDLGYFGLMPISSPLQGHDISEENGVDFMLNSTSRVWWSKFDKEREKATPGRYSVYLNDPEVQVDLLSIGTLAGIHRYAWSSSSSGEAADRSKQLIRLSAGGVVFDVCHAAKLEHGSESCISASLSIDPSNPSVFRASAYFEGHLSGKTWYYFFGEIVVKDPASYRLSKWKVCADGKSCSTSSLEVNSSTGTLYGVASFESIHGPELKNEPLSLEIRVGLSYIDQDLAEQNLRGALREEGRNDLDSLGERTNSHWCEFLRQLSVEALPGDEDLTIMLHSAHYRSLISLTDYTESGGLYRAMDQTVHNVTADRIQTYGEHTTDSTTDIPSYQSRFLSDLSLWDTYRTLHPWLLLTNEDAAIAVARSMGEITVQQQAFPRWVLGSHEASCMIGESGTSFILEALQAGFIKEFDAASIQKYFLKQSTEVVPVNGRTDVDHYLQDGYVSQEASDKSSSLTLTFAFDDFLLSKISEFVGDMQSAEEALKRSGNYKNIWSPESKVFCPKYLSGELHCPRSNTDYVDDWTYYTEGNALHWSWFVPHDPAGLVDLHESPAAFDSALNSFFVEHVDFHEKFGSAVPNPYYWAGNEHSFLVPYLFNFGPDCAKTQYWSRRATEMHFSNNPHGIPGNDDYGSMSTFLTFASLGVFPQAGTSRFLIGSPRVSRAKLTLRHWDSPDSQLEVITYGNSQENVYVQRLLVNGVLWMEPFIERSVLAAPGGVKLEFYMHSTNVSGLCL